DAVPGEVVEAAFAGAVGESAEQAAVVDGGVGDGLHHGGGDLCASGDPQSGDPVGDGAGDGLRDAVRDRVVGERAAPFACALLLLLCVTVTLDQIVTDVMSGLPGDPGDSEDGGPTDVVHDEVLLFCVLVESGDEPPARGA